ncbi:MAG: hypothetical protein HRT90_01265 [Candidatus Margulisbacteria bacterium]|nr:hypothetical protein [Candidatus Margulisiibacteriota bacterium]
MDSKLLEDKKELCQQLQDLTQKYLADLDPVGNSLDRIKAAPSLTNIQKELVETVLLEYQDHMHNLKQLSEELANINALKNMEVNLLLEIGYTVLSQATSFSKEVPQRLKDI